MRSMTCEEWMVASQLYAFLGNSLLSPMSRTESVGLDPAFWRELGGLLDGALADSAESLASWAERASADAARADLPAAFFILGERRVIYAPGTERIRFEHHFPSPQITSADDCSRSNRTNGRLHLILSFMRFSSCRAFWSRE